MEKSEGKRRHTATVYWLPAAADTVNKCDQILLNKNSQFKRMN